ncbi:MAG: wax ester/triacylglycerol synthase family O-acyltransferase [Actinomycetota bacterium]|nr:wax ester/triacylglycerol synthase family O-acyltransferase [Actinomycetota bacterium]
MSPLDALFLHAEDGITHMHIGSCSIFAGPPPSIGEMTALIESKLPLLSRYRQKVRFVPAGLGHPVWVDDPHFNLSYHVRHSALPPPGDEQDLENLMGRLMSQELDRHRPLWEAWVIEGLSDNRWALISKVHHCMVDGISGTDLMAVLLAPDRATTIRAIEPWTPEPEPSDARLTVEAVSRFALNPVRQLLAWRSAGLHPRQSWNRLGDVAAGLRSFGTRIKVPVKPVSVEGAIGPHRRWAAGRCTLDDVKTIRQAFGGSVNDVVLAAISGAFRTVMIERGDPVDDDVVLRSLVPVSVRHADDHTWNNQVSLILAELPVGIADPLVRLAAVHEQMAALKSSHQVTAGEAVVASAEFIPPVLLALGARAAMTVLRRSPQRTVNTVTTNVPGPQFPLYALGREMLEYLPFVPLSEGVRIGVAILSYNGRLTFGITGDYDTAPDVHFMAERIEAEIVALLQRAEHHEVAASGRRR